MRTRRPEGAAGTASDGPRPAAPADVQLRLLAFAGTVDGRLGVQSQVQLCCSSAGPQKSKEPHVCLPSASHRQALARGRSSSSAPAVATWLCTQPHVACLALQASPERGGSKEQRVAYERAGLVSAQSISGAHTVRTMRTPLCTVRAPSELTARLCFTGAQLAGLATKCLLPAITYLYV